MGGFSPGFQLMASNGEALLYSQDPRKQEELRLDVRLDFGGERGRYCVLFCPEAGG